MRLVVLAAGAWVALVAVAVVWGDAIGGRSLRLRAAPLYGHWDPRLTVRVLPAIAVGAAVIWLGPRLAAQLRFRVLLVVAGATTASWAVALALVDGAGALTAPLESRHEYLPFARNVGDVGAFVDAFTERIAELPIHVQGHPPGMVVLLAALDRIGLGSPGWVAALVVAGGAAAVMATLVLTRELASAASARAAAPFLTVLPAAIWIASSADALFAGVGIAGVASLAVAPRGRRKDATALVGGALLGTALHLSYGLALLTPLAGVALWHRRSVRALVLAAAGGALMTLAFLATGFAWWEGLAATHERYVAGVAAARPYRYSLVGNLGALALAVGPAVAIAVAVVRGRLRIVVAAAAAGVVLADVVGLSKGEVERIWLFLMPGLAVATAALAPRGRWWLALQVGAGIGLALVLRAAW